MYHMERLDMLACLHLIYDPAVYTEGVPGSCLQGLKSFGRDLKGTLTTLEGGKEGSLVERALIDLDLTKEAVKKLQSTLAAAPGAGAITAPNLSLGPSGGYSAVSNGLKLSPEVNQERVFSLKEERNSLGHFLFLMSYTRNLRKKEVQSLMRWLAKLDKEEVEVDERGLMGYLVT